MRIEEFVEILAYGREQRGIEFKGPGSRSDKHFLAKVVRAIIGMSNRRDGGLVVIGVGEKADRSLDPIGLNDEQIKSWNYDDFANSIAQYVDPSIVFQSEIVSYDGKKFIAVKVEEFDDIPIICKKDYPDILRAGAVYVRTFRKPETTEIPTHEEMRDLLNLGTEKRLREFLRTARAVGLDPFPPKDEDSDEDQYLAQVSQDE